MLTWTDLSANWSFWATRLLARFPLLDANALAFAKGDRVRVVALLSQAHQLSQHEASEALDDFLLVSAVSFEKARVLSA